MFIFAIPIGLWWVLSRTLESEQGARDEYREVRPEHEAVFVRAMASSNAWALLQLADAFDRCAYDPCYSEKLRYRARLPEKDFAWRQRAQDVFRQALGSGDPAILQHVAAVFASRGLSASAKLLVEVAKGITLAEEIRPMGMSLAPPPPQEEEPAAPIEEPEPEPETHVRIATEGEATT